MRNIKGMSDEALCLSVHPAGEQPAVEQDAAPAPALLDTWAGPVRVEWDPAAPLTPYGQLPFFIEYLKVANLFDAFVADCPLSYTSPNAPEKRDVLGTTMLSVLAGHKRYAHITALRNDGVLPELLGMKKIVSEDAVRRGFKTIGADEGREWLRGHLDYCMAPLLAEPWIIGCRIRRSNRSTGIRKAPCLATIPRSRAVRVMSTTPIRSLCGWCSMWMSLLATSMLRSMPRQRLWQLLDRIPRDCWPALFARR